MAQAEYNLALAEEEAQVARREWERIGSDGLDADAAAEPTALVLHEPQLKLARANLKSAKAALDQAEVNLDRCTITAPFDGRVLDTIVDAGQFIRSGPPSAPSTPPTSPRSPSPIADDDLAWITVNYDADDGGVPVDVSAEFAGARHHWEGRAVRLGGAVDNRSRLVPVVVEIADPYERSGDRPPLIEGMFVDVLFTAEPPAGAVVIPRVRPAARRQGLGRRSENRLQIREVEVARAGVEQAIITGGLAAGDGSAPATCSTSPRACPCAWRAIPAPPQPAEPAKDGER